MLERTGRLSSVDWMLSNKSPSSPMPTSPTTPSSTSSTGSAASVLTEVLSKEGLCEPSQLGFLCSSHGSISRKVVTTLCGGNAELQALFTIAVAAQAKEREGVISLTLLRASLPDSLTREVRIIAATCSVAHRVWQRARFLAHLPSARPVPAAAGDGLVQHA